MLLTSHQNGSLMKTLVKENKYIQESQFGFCIQKVHGEKVIQHEKDRI